MTIEEQIRQKRQEIQKAVSCNILGGFESNIEKSRHGIYADTAENRKLGRVGQEYGKTNNDDETSSRRNIASLNELYSADQELSRLCKQRNESPDSSKLLNENIKQIREKISSGCDKVVRDLFFNIKKQLSDKDVNITLGKGVSGNNLISLRGSDLKSKNGIKIGIHKNTEGGDISVRVYDNNKHSDFKLGDRDNGNITQKIINKYF